MCKKGTSVIFGNSKVLIDKILNPVSDKSLRGHNQKWQNAAKRWNHLIFSAFLFLPISPSCAKYWNDGCAKMTAITLAVRLNAVWAGEGVKLDISAMSKRATTQNSLNSNKILYLCICNTTEFMAIDLDYIRHLAENHEGEVCFRVFYCSLCPRVKGYHDSFQGFGSILFFWSAVKHCRRFCSILIRPEAPVYLKSVFSEEKPD